MSMNFSYRPRSPYKRSGRDAGIVLGIDRSDFENKSRKILPGNLGLRTVRCLRAIFLSKTREKIACKIQLVRERMPCAMNSVVDIDVHILTAPLVQSACVAV